VASRAFPRVQPGGAFRLQIVNGALDSLLDLGHGHVGRRGRFGGQGRPRKAKPQEHPDQGGRANHESTLMKVEGWAPHGILRFHIQAHQCPAAYPGRRTRAGVATSLS
jgi:hypothetical protein